MKETLIKFETAKLAKEKGLSIEGSSMYKPDGKVATKAMDYIRFNLYSRVTQSLLQKWLREEHNIHIQIVVAPMSGLIDYYFLIRFGENIGGIESSNDQLTHDNYESALEEALMQSLKLI